MLTNELISRTLAPYRVTVASSQCELIRSYISLLLKWNRSISLTAVTDEVEILKFHFGESVFALSALSSINGRLADVGTGAGLPGLALRSFCEDIELVLIESNSKKCAFLNEAVRQLGITGVQVLHTRFQDAVNALRGTINSVACRALGGRDDLLNWSSEVLAPDGQVVLWLGKDGLEEISGISGWIWRPPVPILGSKQRFLVVGYPLRSRES